MKVDFYHWEVECRVSIKGANLSDFLNSVWFMYFGCVLLNQSGGVSLGKGDESGSLELSYDIFHFSLFPNWFG